MGYLYIFGTILFTVYGQIILKWRIHKFGSLPQDFSNVFSYYLNVLLDPFILSGLGAAFIASLFWTAAMTKFQISFAYPFMSLSFILVTMLSVFLFGESLTLGKILGLVLIVSGIIVTVKF